MDKVNIIIDGTSISVPKEYTVLQAARSANIDIPTLCYLKDVNAIGACRMCLVEVKGARALQAACVYPVSEGLDIKTNSPTVRKARKTNLELILSNHDKKCLTCVRNRNCELRQLAEDLRIDGIRFEGEQLCKPVDDLSHSIVRDNNKCILCKRCVAVCKNMQGVSVISAKNRGFETEIGCAFDQSLAEVECVNCGQCIIACPVGALREKDDTEKVWDFLADKTKHVIVQTAPAVRISIGEEFGMPIGSLVTGKMAAALRRLGFAGVYDTDCAADFTIMEEGTELIERIQNGGKLPLITSCSPGWVKFCEHNFPDFIDNLSSAKSPHEMFGALAKTYYAEKMNLDPNEIIVVSIMPCTAKKFECQREELSVDGIRDVDVVLTVREAARMIKEAGIDFVSLADEAFDAPFGDASGAGVIFGATGGVMEAALRTVADVLTGNDNSSYEYTEVRGISGVKKADIKIGDLTVKAAVVSGLGNAKRLLKAIESGKESYHFVEIMACPGGCVNGGGQPIRTSKELMDIDVRAERAKGLYQADTSASYRKSHENPLVKKIYSDYLDKPGSHKAHKLLHTHYVKREI